MALSTIRLSDLMDLVPSAQLVTICNFARHYDDEPIIQNSFYPYQLKYQLGDDYFKYYVVGVQVHSVSRELLITVSKEI